MNEHNICTFKFEITVSGRQAYIQPDMFEFVQQSQHTTEKYTTL